jgi:hypothetical protein
VHGPVWGAALHVTGDYTTKAETVRSLSLQHTLDSSGKQQASDNSSYPFRHIASRLGHSVLSIYTQRQVNPCSEGLLQVEANSFIPRTAAPIHLVFVVLIDIIAVVTLVRSGFGETAQWRVAFDSPTGSAETSHTVISQPHLSGIVACSLG